MFKLRSSAALALVVGGLAMAGVGACGDDDDDTQGGGAAPSGSTTASSGSTTTAAVDPSKPPVVIALNALKIPAVDLLSTWGAGADAAAAEINAKGGIGGRKVVIDRCNTAYSPATASICARKTLTKDPVAAIGCDPVWGTSGLPLYAKAKTPSITCPNTEEDFTNPYSIGMTGGAAGDFRAVARWLCTRADVKTVAVFTQDIPFQHSQTPKTITPVLEGCDKTVSYHYYPITGQDITPQVNQAARKKPDFVITLGGGALAVNIYKLFGQAGIPADKIIGSSNMLDYQDVLQPGGAVMEGAYSASEVTSWGETSDPGVGAYLKAMESSDVDPRGSNQLTGYMLVMTVYTAAQKIGADKFTPQALADFLNSANDVPVPGTRSILNPGPTATPQIKQPFVQIVQWKDGKLNVVQDGTDKGWVNGH